MGGADGTPTFSESREGGDEAGGAERTVVDDGGFDPLGGFGGVEALGGPGGCGGDDVGAPPGGGGGRDRGAVFGATDIGAVFGGGGGALLPALAGATPSSVLFFASTLSGAAPGGGGGGALDRATGVLVEELRLLGGEDAPGGFGGPDAGPSLLFLPRPSKISRSEPPLLFDAMSKALLSISAHARNEKQASERRRPVRG